MLLNMFVDFVSKLPTAILGTIGVFWLVNSFVNKMNYIQDTYFKNLSSTLILSLLLLGIKQLYYGAPVLSIASPPHFS